MKCNFDPTGHQLHRSILNHSASSNLLTLLNFFGQILDNNETCCFVTIIATHKQGQCLSRAHILLVTKLRRRNNYSIFQINFIRFFFFHNFVPTTNVNIFMKNEYNTNSF